METANQILNVTASQWTKVSTGCAIEVNLLDNTPQYAFVLQPSGSSAPSNNNGGLPLNSINKVFTYGNGSDFDLYIRCAGKDNGQIAYTPTVKHEYLSSELECSGVISTESCQLTDCFGFNTFDENYYLHLFDMDACPSGSETPKVSMLVGNSGSFSLEESRLFSTGISFAFSNSPTSWQDPSGSMGIVNAVYKT